MNYRNEKYRRLVAQLDCAHCGRSGRSQAAHSGLSVHGKGMSLKASDAAIFPLCADDFAANGCHFRFDQHQLFKSKAEEIEATHRFIANTMMKLLQQDYLTINNK